MKILCNEGCFDKTTTIDDKKLEDLSNEELVDVLKQVINKLDRYGKESTLIDIVTSLGNYNDNGSCEQCGAHWCDYELNI